MLQRKPWSPDLESYTYIYLAMMPCNKEFVTFLEVEMIFLAKH